MTNRRKSSRPSDAAASTIRGLADLTEDELHEVLAPDYRLAEAIEEAKQSAAGFCNFLRRTLIAADAIRSIIDTPPEEMRSEIAEVVRQEKRIPLGIFTTKKHFESARKWCKKHRVGMDCAKVSQKESSETVLRGFAEFLIERAQEIRRYAATSGNPPRDAIEASMLKLPASLGREWTEAVFELRKSLPPQYLKETFARYVQTTPEGSIKLHRARGRKSPTGNKAWKERTGPKEHFENRLRHHIDFLLSR